MEACLLHNLKNKIFIAHNRVKQIINLVDSDPLDRESLRAKAVLTDQALTDMTYLIGPELKAAHILKDLASSVQLCVEQFSDLPIRIVLEIKNCLPILIKEDCLQAVMLNILKNAYEAEAKVCVIILERNKLSIIDDGVGMSDEALNLALQGKAFTTKLTGSGMGIEAINEICKSQRWSYKVNHAKDNTPNSGVKCILTFS